MSLNVDEDYCGCCEINDYEPVLPGQDGVPGSCYNCGHSPEEHEAA
jgi:hypothetical protein